MSNNSMDVRAKQRLSFGVVRQTLACVYSVSPHVISTVGCLFFAMGMFDYYQPSEKIFCPDCKIELGGWQGKDSICALLLWKQGQPFPESTLNDEEIEMPEEVRRTWRLPEKFTFYSFDCEKHYVLVEGRTENGVWVDNRIILVEDLAKKYAEAKRQYSRYR